MEKVALPECRGDLMSGPLRFWLVLRQVSVLALDSALLSAQDTLGLAASAPGWLLLAKTSLALATPALSGHACPEPS